MLAPFKKGPDRLQAAQRVKQWTRSRFKLAGDAMVLVTEVESAVPGFPPLHAVIAFRSAENKHYHFKVFKPLEAVTEEDVPPAWYKPALAVTPGADCGCC